MERTEGTKRSKRSYGAGHVRELKRKTRRAWLAEEERRQARRFKQMLHLLPDELMEVN